jgi:acyl-CoA synthetase (AMP-forming)/AMP-acid ligase II
MDGLMMDEPLLLTSLLWRTERLFHDKEIVTRLSRGGYHRYTYADFGQRVRKLANALASIGVTAGDRVGTLAWNHYRHLEAYYAVPGMGATLHTVNMRLFEEQQAYTINHAGSSVLLFDPDQLSVVERLVEIGIPQVRAFVLMSDSPLPTTSVSPLYGYEHLMSAASSAYEFPLFPENTAAAICYTSATTGDPKGVVYSHRALVLQSLILGMNGMLGVGESSVWMPIAPMFHANAWCVPHTCVAQGATIVLAGEHPLDRDYLQIIQDQRVTGVNAAVTVGQMMRDCVERGDESFDLSSLKLMWLGAQAPPRGILEWWQTHNGTRAFTGYGMTESSPQVCFNSTKSTLAGDPPEEQWRRRTSGGLPIPLMRIKIVDEHGRELPWDGESVGTVCLRSPYTASGYLAVEPAPDHESLAGWFRTGDVAVIDPDGYVTVKDRVKDMIKSGGEWISSIDLENALMTHPAIREAMVVSVSHPKWQERPVALLVARDPDIDEAALRSYLSERFAKWWIPDEFIFVPELPKTSMGKLNKKHARALLAEGTLTGTAPGRSAG